jgi:hypothetical protein
MKNSADVDDRTELFIGDIIGGDYVKQLGMIQPANVIRSTVEGRRQRRQVNHQAVRKLRNGIFMYEKPHAYDTVFIYGKIHEYRWAREYKKIHTYPPPKLGAPKRSEAIKNKPANVNAVGPAPQQQKPVMKSSAGVQTTPLAPTVPRGTQTTPVPPVAAKPAAVTPKPTASVPRETQTSPIPPPSVGPQPDLVPAIAVAAVTSPVPKKSEAKDEEPPAQQHAPASTMPPVADDRPHQESSAVNEDPSNRPGPSPDYVPIVVAVAVAESDRPRPPVAAEVSVGHVIIYC